MFYKMTKLLAAVTNLPEFPPEIPTVEVVVVAVLKHYNHLW